MTNCDLIDTCGVLNEYLAQMPTTAEVYKRMYCLRSFDKCARYMVVKSMGQGATPQDLLPNQTDRAMMIIQGR